ncbi:hypothetical protein DLAC_08753 [Tieghemostelium lacteum]|uniref:Uncharacterized protein n=1 Tax=Tieghemostelium lacteum TaxID=361077 RepID=A0A151Z882_TIELA|nr:hypothetical protein DLAC_08753 [Tieghemostelium lacteum]|eukprot:KYQ90162.1 hypothetical protein DLAC_08753 [Tieghemostelium lacteum]
MLLYKLGNNAKLIENGTLINFRYYFTSTNKLLYKIKNETPVKPHQQQQQQTSTTTNFNKPKKSFGKYFHNESQYMEPFKTQQIISTYTKQHQNRVNRVVNREFKTEIDNIHDAYDNGDLEKAIENFNLIPYHLEFENESIQTAFGLVLSTSTKKVEYHADGVKFFCQNIMFFRNYIKSHRFTEFIQNMILTCIRKTPEKDLSFIDNIKEVISFITANGYVGTTNVYCDLLRKLLYHEYIGEISREEEDFLDIEIKKELIDFVFKEFKNYSDELGLTKYQPEIYYYLIQRQLLGDDLEEVQKTLLIMKDHLIPIEKGIFQAIFECCKRTDRLDQIELFIHEHMPSFWTIYSLIFYNQVTGNIEIFRRLEQLLRQKNTHTQQFTIDCITKALLVYGRFELALDWFYKKTHVYRISHNSEDFNIFMNFSLYHKSRDSPNFLVELWRDRAIDYGYEPNLYMDMELDIRYSKMNPTKIIQEINDYTKPYGIQAYTNKEQMAKLGLNMSIPVPSDDPNGEIAHVEMDPILDKLVSDKNIPGIVDYLIKMYFNNMSTERKLIPGSLFGMVMYTVKQDIEEYKRLIMASNPYYRALLFDHKLYNYYLQNHFDEGIVMLSKEDPMFFKLDSTYNSIVKGLLVMDNVELALKVGSKMAKEKRRFECHNFIAHKADQQNLEIPEQLYEYLHQNYLTSPLFNYHIQQLVNQHEYHQVLEYIDRHPELANHLTYKILVQRVYPEIYPANCQENIDTWFLLFHKITKDSQKTRGDFYEFFFKSLIEHGHSQKVLDMVMKPGSTILSQDIRQTTFYLILKCTEDPFTRIQIIHKTRAFESYYQDIIDLITEANKVAQDPWVETLLNRHTTPKKIESSKGSPKILSKESLEFLKHFI